MKRKKLKKSLCILLSLFLSVVSVNTFISYEKVYAYGMTAAATNDYTTWKQTSSSWGEARPWPNASIPKFGDAGCWITSVAILLRHYNVVTDSNVNSFNPLICNNRLMQYGIVNSAGDFCNLGNIKNAYPGFEYVGQKSYSFSNLKSLYDQGYACIVHETRGHYVAVRSVSSSGVVVMDPGYSTTSLTNSDTIQYYRAKPTDTTNPTIEDVYVKDVSASGYTVHCIVRDDQALGYVRFPTWTAPNDQDDIIWGTPGEIAGQAWELNYRVNVSDHNNEVNCWYITHIYCYDAAGNVTSYAAASVFVENIPPVISDVQITDISEKGYTVSCVVNDEHSGVNRVQFPTWFGDDNPYAYDGSWRTSEFCKGKLINGRYTYRVNTSDYGNRLGKYTTHIYAWDGSGNQSAGYATETIIKKTHQHDYTSTIKKPATCTEPGILLYICKDNDDSYEKEIPATGHQHTELRDVKESTCAQEGYTGDTYCTDCGTKLFSGKVLEKKPHTWDDGTITTEATCTEKGVRTYTCTVCNETKTEEISATGHRHPEERNVKAATCAQEGYTGDMYCKDCNTKLSSGKVLEKKPHTWDSGKITKEATCSEKGIKTYTCVKCNAIKQERLPETGHRNTEYRNIKPATCAETGYTGDLYCKDCNMMLRNGEKIEKKPHTWNDGTITTEATCTEKGIKTYTCTVCNETKTEEIPATGHQHTELRNAKESTCVQEGYTGDTYCADCGMKLSSGKSISKTDHTWDAGKVTKNANCIVKGSKTFTCTVCEATKTEEIPVTGHKNKITKFAKKASCKSDGYTGDIYCQDCGVLLEEGNVIPKSEHTWNAGEVTKPATCTDEGTRTYTCTGCGTTQTGAIAATGHGATEIRNKKDATTTSEGYTGDTYCTICNQKISSGKKIAKLTPQTATPGKTIKDKSTNGVYKVLQDGVSVEFTKPVYKKASVRIPDTIKVNGITCKVTGISANAFKNNKSLKSVTLGRNVTVIGTNAFYGCKKLSKVNGGNGIVKIGHRAFANCSSLSKITIPGSVRSVGKQAFCNCKKLRSITIKTSTLSGKTVGSKAFAGTYKKPTVKVPAKQLKAYKKLLKARGMSSKAVYRK